MKHFPQTTIRQIKVLCEKYKIRELGLFGSRARGESRVDSDYDFLIDFEPDARIDLIALTDIKFQLEDLLKRDVDLVPKSGLKKRIRRRVLEEVENVYAG